jgi:two-component system chemotaxis response regulator CheB
VSRLAVVLDDYSLGTLPGLGEALAQSGALVLRSFRGMPNPQLLRRMPECQGAAVVGGPDRRGLIARLETATATLAAPVIAALPPGVAPTPELCGPGVVDVIPAGTARAAERVALMAAVPIVTRGARLVSSAPAVRPRPGPTSASSPPAARDWDLAEGAPQRVIGIASSTGGVWVLARLLGALRGRETVLIAQHLEGEFVPFFAEWLTSVSGMRTVVVSDPVPLEPGTAYLPAGGLDLHLDGERAASAAPISRFVPCADRLLRSLARTFGPRAAAAVLSGMGSDGAEGAAEVWRAGGRAVCQLPSTAVVPSMPESALRRAPGMIAVAPDALAEALVA